MKSKKQILILEDDEGIRQTLENVFSHYGFEVTETGNSAQFITAIGDKQFDLLITDFNLADTSFDGIHAVLLAREKNPQLPVVMITAESPFHWRILQLLKLDRTVILEKPFNLSNISAALMKFGFDLK